MKATGDIGNDHDLLRKILETSVSAITVLNIEGTIVYANEAAKEILGLEPSQITGKAFNDPQWAITTFDGKPFPEHKVGTNIHMIS
jgi:PAS domain-containing protein